MTIKIIGLIIGILVLGTGVYYLAKEQHDPESKKIYTVISVIGGIITAVCAGMLWLFCARPVSTVLSSKKAACFGYKAETRSFLRCGTVRGDLLPAVPNISAHISRF